MVLTNLLPLLKEKLSQTSTTRVSTKLQMLVLHTWKAVLSSSKSTQLLQVKVSQRWPKLKMMLSITSLPLL